MTGPDIVARMHRMQGYNVMFPMGFDGFGLPAENAAINRGIHPSKWTYQNIDTMRRQMRVMGASFDWTARSSAATRVLPLAAVAVPEAVRGRARLQGDGRGQLVPEGQGRTGS